MLIVFSLLTFIYCLLVAIMYHAWIRLGERGKGETEREGLKVSIVVAVRNEEKNINKLLEDLAKQQIDFDQFEVIIVDDASEDQTLSVVQEFKKHSPYALHLFSLKIDENVHLPAKKKALGLGIEKASGEVIITTDGDCRVGRCWISSVLGVFEQKNVVMVSGPVTFYREDGFFEKLQTIEFASLIGTGAASLYLNKPNMCNGANLAFLKQVYKEVGGYQGNEHIASGDDEFLLHKVCKQYAGRVHFHKDQKAIVYTRAQSSFSEFYAQRKRWGSKWRFHTGIKSKLLAFFIFFYHFSLILAGVLVMSGQYPFEVFLIQIFSKLAVEFVFLRSIMQFLGKVLSFYRFLFLQAVYSLYVVVFGLVANFGSTYWKGRKMKY
jgi:poly-beta-1,6-N-acetyl-D-glucosamine synthase